MATNPEKAFISAVVRTGDYSTTVGQELDPALFVTHADEWKWISKYLSKHRRCPSKVAFIGAFPDFSFMRADDLEHFADEVRKAFARRQMQRSMKEAADLLNSGQLDQATAVMQSSLLASAETMGTVTDSDMLREGADDVLQAVTTYRDRIIDTGFPGYPTGLATLDDATGGVKPGEVMIVAGRTGVGKSWMLTELASTMCMAGHTVLYESLEMSKAMVSLRAQTLLSAKTGRPYAAASLLSGRELPDLVGYKEQQAWLGKHVSGRLCIADTKHGGISPLSISAQIERIRPQVVMIDYLTLLKRVGVTSGDWEGVADLSSQIQHLAQRYEVGIVCAAQLNRAATENSRGKNMPGLETMSRSDAIGMDADSVVISVPRTRRVLQSVLAKNRSGPGGMSWWTHFEPGKGIYEEVPYDVAERLMDEDNSDNV